MITSGSRPFWARPVRSVLTHCLQDLSTKSIPPSHSCGTFSLFFLDPILVALNLCFLWPDSRADDTYCQIKGKILTRPLSILQNQYSSRLSRGYNAVQLSLPIFSYSPTPFSCAQICPNNPRMPFAQPNTFPIFEITPTKFQESHAIKSQRRL